MKRYGHLMEQIAEPDNLRLAFWKASKGKRGKQEVIRFREDLSCNLEALEEQLRTDTCEVGQYHTFREIGV